MANRQDSDFDDDETEKSGSTPTASEAYLLRTILNKNKLNLYGRFVHRPVKATKFRRSLQSCSIRILLYVENDSSF